MIDTEEKVGVVFFCDSLPPLLDGVSRVLLNYTQELDKQKSPCCIVGPKGKGTAESFPCTSILLPSIRPKFIAPYPIILPFSARRVANHLKPFNPSVIHAHSPFTMGSKAHKIAKKLNIPSIITIHSRYKHDILARTGSNVITKYMIRKIVHCISQFSEVWVPTPGVKEEILGYGYTGNVTIIGNAIDFPTVDNDQLEQLRLRGRALYKIDDPAEIICLFVGQHRKDKGVFTILEALRMLENSTPLKMIFIGDGPEKCAMQKFIDTHKMHHKVLLKDPVSDREIMQQLYAGADLFLFPSEYDTDGIVMKEAAAMGTPSVLLKDSLSASSGLYKDMDNAFLIQNNPSALANKIRAIISNRALLEKTSIQARLSIPKTWSNSIHEIEENYRRTIREFYS